MQVITHAQISKFLRFGGGGVLSFEKHMPSFSNKIHQNGNLDNNYFQWWITTLSHNLKMWITWKVVITSYEFQVTLCKSLKV